MGNIRPGGGSSTPQHLEQGQQQQQQQQRAPSVSGPLNPLHLLFGKSWRKAVLLLVLFFASTFIFTMLQSLKDGIVVMAMGAEALPFLTTLGSLPASLAFFGFYRTVLVPLVPPQHLFYATAAPFLAFYALFAVLLYPLAPRLHHPAWLAGLPQLLPQGLRGLAAVLQQPLYSLFYVVADLYGPVMISLAFWTVADEVCSMEEAALLYPRLGLLANLGLAGSGGFIAAVHRAVGPGGMGAVLQVLVLAMLATAGLMFGCKALLNKHYLALGPQLHHQQQQHHQTQQQLQKHHSLQQQGSQHQQHSASLSRAASVLTAATAQQQQQQPGSRASWGQVVGVLCSNPTAAALASSVVGFSVAYRMWEYSFEAQLQLAAADSAAYCCRLAEIQSAVGLATMGLMLGSRLIFKYLGWAGAALISPLSLLLPGAAFFSCSLLAQVAAADTAAATASSSSSSSAGLLSWLAAAATLAAAHLVDQLRSSGLALPAFPGLLGSPGLLQLDSEALVVMGLGAGFATALAACACHNSLFTPCKQMVYKTLPQQQQAESKAAVDLVGGQFAKSAAGWLLQALLLAYGNIAAALPACFLIFVAALAAWLAATLHLAQQMRAFSAAQPPAAEGLAVKLPGALAAGQAALAVQQQQQPQVEGWWLPLPRELAAAAAAAVRWPAAPGPAPAALNSMRTGGDASGSVTSDMMYDIQGGQVVEGGVALPTSPHLLHDAAYWDRVLAAVAADAVLLEAAVTRRELDYADAAQQQQQQQQPGGLQQEPAAVPLHYVAGQKQALHTVFDT